jgi:NADH-quinone oxidoreductase subunit C
MTDTHQDLAAHAQEKFGESITAVHEFTGQLTLDVHRDRIVEICRTLRDDPAFAFEQVMDVCGVDYLEYGRESPCRSGTTGACVCAPIWTTRVRRSPP